MQKRFITENYFWHVHVCACKCSPKLFQWTQWNTYVYVFLEPYAENPFYTSAHFWDRTDMFITQCLCYLILNMKMTRYLASLSICSDMPDHSQLKWLNEFFVSVYQTTPTNSTSSLNSFVRCCSLTNTAFWLIYSHGKIICRLFHILSLFPFTTI